jgi:hypothetical protein
LPAFPRAEFQWPWPDGFAFHKGWSNWNLDPLWEGTHRELLHAARSWLGRSIITNTDSDNHTHIRRGLGYIAPLVNDNYALWLWFGSAFQQIGAFALENIQGDDYRWVCKSFDLAPFNMPEPLTDPVNWGYGGGPVTPGGSWPQRPRVGRWNSTRFSISAQWGNEAPQQQPLATVNCQFYFMNGIWAGWDLAWIDTFGGGTPDVPEITPAQESELTVALQGRGFQFDPETLFVTYDV